MDNAEYIECEKEGEKSRARGKNQVQINGTVAVHPSIHPSPPIVTHSVRQVGPGKICTIVFNLQLLTDNWQKGSKDPATFSQTFPLSAM